MTHWASRAERFALSRLRTGLDESQRRQRFQSLHAAPVNSLMRAILGAHHGGGRGPGVAGRFLNHNAPIELVRPNAKRPNTPATTEAIREHYDEQLTALGL